MSTMLHNEIVHIKGIGPKRAEILKQDAGIESIEDFLYYMPRRYIDRSSFKLIKDCFVNDVVTVAGIIKKQRISGKRKRFLEVIIDDGSDTLIGVFFGGIEYFQKIFTIGEFVIFSGKINYFNNKQIVHPDFDFIDDTSNLNSINTGRIIPLYRSTEKLKQIGFDSRGFRRFIKIILDQYLNYVEESIDQTILNRINLIGIKEALLGIHFPDSFEHAKQARRRLAFNEIFFLQYYLSLSRRFIKENCVKKTTKIDESIVNSFISNLSFQLTPDQESALRDIKNDIVSPYPMNRLLQGDVGSGKTVVAMASALLSISSGNQVAFMVPTEVLASQHYSNFKKYLDSIIKIQLITGGTPKNDKETIYQDLSAGNIDLIIGTHALIQKDISFKKLGLIIIDEQHRFGVEQRSTLREKGKDVDLLVMTATPIPRSLSLTLYGDLDISSIRTMPQNRLPIRTLVFQESKLQSVYNSLEKYIKQGRQIYYVLPLIEESEKIDLKSAIEVYENLKNNIFSHRKIELLHGRMKQSEKDLIMENFKNGLIDLLVSTTVIEVGIDVPNANVIVIEHAERFGLSQLHQLRGRVGRGKHQSFCVLIHPDNIAEESRNRINTIVTTLDGFKISEEDLKQRGAGELIGLKQHGHSSFEFIDLVEDVDLILKAREEANVLISKLNNIEMHLDQLKNKKYDLLLTGIRKKRILSILA